MWHGIAQQLSQVLAFEFVIQERESLQGGDCNQCYMISDGQQRYFVKINDREYLPKFESEIDNLSSLLQTSTLSVPQPVTCGVVKDHAFLILNYLPTKPLTAPTEQYHLGQQLAHLHLWGEQKEYGYDADTYVGLNLQPNAWHKKWGIFFSECRIGWQLQLLKEKGIEFGDIEEIVTLVKQRIGTHNPKPSLLHGNLSDNNYALSVNGAICYDPSSYWGDPEYDLAIIEEFSNLGSEFFAGYEDTLSIEDGYDKRRELYQLYYLLCRCNQYGGEYLTQCISKIQLIQQDLI
ncbi:fructosamine kinase family protein [Vibrio algivorus]|uniref:Fructosamine kinase family protein n=1 Tax=Vibrio algivorus TaxID=1667024 RepID=A0A557P7H9_9VIBR|nr:fructosamine kinase family protein [Vibrio algivorus]TVO36611.1 fructosamine kinase family protein [Vibrio algivorus]